MTLDLPARGFSQEQFLEEVTKLRQLAAIVLFLQRIEFWNDEDSGHWEETRKAAASRQGRRCKAGNAPRRI